MKIYFTDHITQVYMDKLIEDGHEVEVWDRSKNGEITPNDLIRSAIDSDAIVTMLSNDINCDVINSLPRLKIIAQYAVGFNNIDIEAAKKKSIIVTNTPNVLTDATAELAMALLLNSARNIEAARLNVVNDQWRSWEPTGFIGKSLFGIKHGVIGAGRIGTKFAQMCHRAFDQEILYTGPNKKEEIESSCKATFLELETLLKESDVISIHCPYNKSTHQLISKEQFALMKEDVILINTARGEIINEEDMYEFFYNNIKARAGLDVVCNEPLKKDSKLRQLSNMFILPHIGSANQEARGQMSKLVYENITQVLEGKSALTAVK